MQATPPESNRTTYLKFLVPSLIGVFVFLFPVRQDGVLTIPMGVAAGWLSERFSPYMDWIVLGIVAVSAAASLWVTSRPAAESRGSRMRQIFAVNRLWLVLRIIGLIMAVLIVSKTGPELIWSDQTGGLVVSELAPLIIPILFIASFLMPLLTDYGLMELIGTLLSRVFRRLFLLPGRACIDALASWMAAAPVGVMITSQQYESGNYSGREAAVIATNFSVVSVAFCLIVAQFVGLEHIFFQYYLTVVVCGLVAAMITPRIPPLSRIPDDYSEAGQQLHEELDAGEGLLRAGLDRALTKARAAPGVTQVLSNGVHNLADIWFGLMPPLIAIGTTGLIVAEYTPLFTWLSYPFIYVLQLMQIPEASAAAPALLVGFADMFLPAVLAKPIESEMTRFVIASVSITQLIYMTEVGVMILKTRIPLNILNLMQVFLLRTLITLPIAAAIAHFLIYR